MPTTRNRRASVLNMHLPFAVLTPLPDGDLNNQEDRQHMGRVYARALSAPAPIESKSAGGTTSRFYRRRYRRYF